MMKKFTKAICWILCLIMGTSMVTACGSKVDDGEQTLSIWVSETGYGSQWLKDALAAFKEQDWVKEKYPELKTTLAINTTDGTFGFETTVAGKTHLDLIVSVASGGNYYGSGKFLDMTSVYDSEVPGEGVTLKEKMKDDIYFQQGYEQINGETKYYCVPWLIGNIGLFYNEDVIIRAFGENYEMPNTTDELIQFCKDLKKNGEVPIIGSHTSDYWIEIFKLFWAQYNGIKEYTSFWYGLNEDGEYTSDVAKQEGRKYALIALNEMLNADNGLIHEDCMIKDYKTMQSWFLAGKGAIMANGDWLANEMEGEDSSSVRMMKTPVISDIIKRCKSIDTDAKLSFVIDCIDNGDDFATTKDKYAENNYGTLTDGDYNRIYEARNTTSLYGGLGFHIPAYATAKEVAKDFIRFCATDEGIRIITNAGKGFLTPYEYTPSDEDFATFTSMAKDSWTYTKTAVYMPPHTMFRLFCYGGLIPIASTVNTVGNVFMPENAEDRYTPEEIYNKDIEYYTKNWSNILSKAGI